MTLDDDIRSEFFDTYNPMKLYPQLMRLGFDKRKAMEISSLYDSSFYRYFVQEYNTLVINRRDKT